jgi:uncharacterized OB-fold protein
MTRYKGYELLVQPNDSERRGYFEAAGRGEFVVQACRSCHKLRGSIGAACPFCTSMVWEWQEVSGLGTIYSFAIVCQSMQPAFSDWVPYPIVLVELEEQRELAWRHGRHNEAVSVRVTTNLCRRDDVTRPEDENNVAIGRPVEVCFYEIGDGLAIPHFQLADAVPSERD